jgi:hypothetical protein
MESGDALIFHALPYHFTEPTTSNPRRRALPFHYHQTGAIWADVAEHNRHFHFDDGRYAACTVAHDPAQDAYRGVLPRPVVPMEPYD